MTLKKRAKIAVEVLAKQQPVTIEEARAQCLKLRGDFKTQKEALEFVKGLSNEEYMAYIQGKPKIK